MKSHSDSRNFLLLLNWFSVNSSTSEDRNDKAGELTEANDFKVDGFEDI